MSISKMLQRRPLSSAIARVETLDARKLFSAGFTGFRGGFNTTGPSTGLNAAAATPRTTDLLLESRSGSNPLQNANRDTAIQLRIEPGSMEGGLKETSLSRAQFQVFENGVATAILTSTVQTSGGGDTLLLKPTSLLKANTNYTVRLNQSPGQKITDVGNNAFQVATYTFRTGTFFNAPDANIKFDRQRLVTKTSNGSFAAVTIGPDNRLYASTLEGYIYRYNINESTGGLSNEFRIDTVRSSNAGAKRFITGITFDPRGTDPADPVLWVSHGEAKFGDTPGTGTTQDRYADNYTGKISRLTGANLDSYQDVIVNIPRSVKDHLNNQIAFDASNRNLYFLIPSQSAMGRADATWGNRPEELTTAAMFRLQLRSRGSRVGIEEWLATKGPINLDPTSATRYNPYKGSNPLRFFATGIRNAYDMVWHTNGHFYAPANGSAAGGNTPGTPSDLSTVPVQNRLDAAAGPYTGPTAPQLSTVQQFANDFLFDVKEGGYYGHPNPTRGEYVLNGGNPTTRTDPAEIRDYPVGTQPDRNYRGFAFDFGRSQSPNGVIEYKSNSFGGRLKGSLIVTRYSSGDDLIVVTPKADGTFDSGSGTLGIIGFSGFVNESANPLDLVEDPRNGNIYVVNLTDRYGDGAISVLKPRVGSLTPNLTRVGLYDTPGDSAGATRTVTYTNNTPNTFTLDPAQVRFNGASRRLFAITNLPANDVVIQPGGSISFEVKYTARDTATRRSNLYFPSNDPASPRITIQVRGFPIGNQGASVAAAKPVTGVFSVMSIAKEMFAGADETLRV